MQNTCSSEVTPEIAPLKRIRERDLIVPSLEIMLENGGNVSTRDLIANLRLRLQPEGEDLDILEGRTDDRFSQKVRNLRSHKTFERMSVARYGVKAREDVGITRYGRIYLEKYHKQQEEIRIKREIAEREAARQERLEYA